MAVCFPGIKTVRFRISGFTVAELGNLKEPPNAIEVPEDFYTDKWKSPQYMQLKYYYLLHGRRKAILIQIEDFIVKKWESSSWAARAECSVRFRYMGPASGVEELNAMLSPPKSPTPSATAARWPEKQEPPQKPSTGPEELEPPSVSPPPERDQLLTDCGSFQQDAAKFLDEKPPKATVKGCDALVSGATELDARIETILITLGADIKSMEAKVKSLEDQLEKQENIVIKDSVQTMINDLKKNEEDNGTKQKEWAARQRGIRDTRETLKSFRLILEVFEGK